MYVCILTAAGVGRCSRRSASRASRELCRVLVSVLEDDGHVGVVAVELGAVHGQRRQRRQVPGAAPRQLRHGHVSMVVLVVAAGGRLPRVLHHEERLCEAAHAHRVVAAREVRAHRGPARHRQQEALPQQRVLGAQLRHVRVGLRECRRGR